MYLHLVLSVLLPARNAAATLPAALEGLFAQRGAPPFEIVCVDDASSDDTPRVLAAASRADSRLVVVQGEGRGLVAALQLGLRRCRGDIVARMDADDLVHPDRLRLQADALARDPTLGAVGSLVRCFPRPISAGLARLEDWLDSVVSKEECRRARFIEAPLVHPSMTFRRSAVEALGGFRDQEWAEDWDLQLRLLEAGFELCKVPEVLLWWRDSPGRLTRVGPAYAAGRMIELRAHHLARGPLRGRLFDLWGAGPTGKRLARALETRGLRPRRFIDVAPERRVARGLEVVPPAALGPPGEALVLCAVGASGAREEIRADLARRGYSEGKDYLFAA
jgi:glycosyltransferase involved in cell wall biosynthesis